MTRASSVSPLDRTNVFAAGALAVATGIAWVGLAGYEAPMGLPGFLSAWTLMMVAMMVPSVVPLVLLYRGSRTLLVAGYIALWGAVGLLPYVAMEWGLEPALPIVLALAGAYELSPLKAACLRRCRNVAAFLMEHYRSGPFRLGVEHGAWCIGCCVGLMAVLVLAAAMALAWAAVIGALVFVQKVLPLGDAFAPLIGVGFLAAAVVALIV